MFICYERETQHFIKSNTPSTPQYTSLIYSCWTLHRNCTEKLTFTKEPVNWLWQQLQWEARIQLLKYRVEAFFPDKALGNWSGHSLKFLLVWFYYFVHLDHKATNQQHAAIPLKEEQPQMITATMLSPLLLFVVISCLCWGEELLCLVLPRNSEKRANGAQCWWLHPSGKHLQNSPNLTHEWSLGMNDSTALPSFVTKHKHKHLQNDNPDSYPRSCCGSLWLVSFSLTDRSIEETWPWAEDHAKSRIYLV